MGRIWPCTFSSLKPHKDLTIYYCFFIICFNCHWFACSEGALSWLKPFVCVCGCLPSLQSSNCSTQGPPESFSWATPLCFPGRVFLAMQGLHDAGPLCMCVQLSRCYPLPTPILQGHPHIKTNEHILTRWTGKQLFNQLCRRRFITGTIWITTSHKNHV